MPDVTKHTTGTVQRSNTHIRIIHPYIRVRGIPVRNLSLEFRQPAVASTSEFQAIRSVGLSKEVMIGIASSYGAIARSRSYVCRTS